jgi:hypothetical protein
MIEAYRLANVLIQVAASRYVGQDGILRRIVNPPISLYSPNLTNPRHPKNPVTNA